MVIGTERINGANNRDSKVVAVINIERSYQVDTENNVCNCVTVREHRQQIN